MQCLRSKKTGEIAEFTIHKRIEDSEDGNQVYAPFVIDPEEWEKYEEPIGWWYIDIHGPHNVIKNDKYYQVVKEASKEIGNYFETKEEAEKTVEKLKAFKRLKDKGFRFKGLCDSVYELPAIEYDIGVDVSRDSQEDEDLNLLFGGEK